MEKITVVLATFNGERFITALLDSLRNQTKRIDEVIIFDDCSNDSTFALLDKYIVEHNLGWKLYKQEANVGYIKNFASGLKAASGDLIFLCDQDDIWKHNKVEKMSALFKQKEIMCVNSSFAFIDADNQGVLFKDDNKNHGFLWKEVKKHDFEEITFEEIVYHNISMGCTMGMRKEVVQYYFEFSNFKAPHDWELNMIASLLGKLAFYNEELIDYRIHENNVVGNDKLNKRNHIYASEREKNAITMVTYANCFTRYESLMSGKQIKLSRKLCLFYEKRCKMLLEKRIKLWIELLKNKDIYKKIISRKGILTELLYILR